VGTELIRPADTFHSTISPATKATMFHKAAALSAWSILALSLLAFSGPASAQGSIAGSGRQVFDSRWKLQAFDEIAGGAFHTLARRSDGAIAAWGEGRYGQCTVPAPPSGLVYLGVAGGAAILDRVAQRRQRRGLGEQ
jgi:hypothetical protein